MIYLIKNKVDEAHQRGQWGDYAHILLEGFASSNSKGDILIDKCMPYTPPIYISCGKLICQKNEKDRLSSKINYTFTKAKINKTITLKWKEWNADIEIWRYISQEKINAPMDIFKVYKNEKCDSAIELFVIETSTIKEVKLIFLDKTTENIKYQGSPPEGIAIFKPSNFRGYIATELAKSLLEENPSNNLIFTPINEE